jgi:hypothetical protein
MQPKLDAAKGLGMNIWGSIINIWLHLHFANMAKWGKYSGAHAPGCTPAQL